MFLVYQPHCGWEKSGTEVDKLWPGRQIWPVACFPASSEIRAAFLLLKRLKEENNMGQRGLQ